MQEEPRPGEGLGGPPEPVQPGPLVSLDPAPAPVAPDRFTLPNKDGFIYLPTAGDPEVYQIPRKYFMAIVAPPSNVLDKQVLPREHVFVVDTSASMFGMPMLIMVNITNRM